MSKPKYCEYCYPINNSSAHLWQKVESFYRPTKRYKSKLKPKQSTARQAIFKTLLQLCLKTNILQKSNIKKQVKDQRVKLLNKSALRNGIDMQMIRLPGFESSVFVASKKNKSIYFETLPTLNAGSKIRPNIDDKIVFKQMLTHTHLPVAEGKVFANSKKAKFYVQSELKFPVVVKPLNGSLSMHVSTNITNLTQLGIAIKAVKKISHKFVVEHFVQGRNYRILCIDGKFCAASLRLPPTIVGNGTSTILQLVKEYNLQNQQLEFSAIQISPYLKKHLLKQGIQYSDILPKGQRQVLINKVVVAAGGRQVDVTHKVNQQIIKQSEKIAKLCDLPVLGIDIIAANISKPKSGDYVFVEANSLPYFDMHKNADGIADKIWGLTSIK